MAARMRVFDWSRSELGLPSAWSATLRAALRIVLSSSTSMAVSWGPSLTFLYNDACRELLGSRHPWALGQPESKVWGEQGPPRLFAAPLASDGGQLDGVLCVYRCHEAAGGGHEGQLAELFTRLVTIQEDERRRISRDIHDHLGQQLTALRMSLEALAAQSTADPTLLAYTARAQRIAQEVDETVDFLAWELRPAALERDGLSAALSSLAHGWSVRVRMAVHFESSGIEGLRFSPAVEANVYRLAQEALHNVFRHARANRVSVFFGRFHDHAILTVEDDGCGFSPSTQSGGLGLEGMRERASLVGAELHVESEPGRGTSVLLRLPLPDGDHASRSQPRATA